MVLVAHQPILRDKKGKKPCDIYWWSTTRQIYYNNGIHQAHYVPLGATENEMKKFWRIFVEAPLTKIEKAWLARNRFELLHD